MRGASRHRSRHTPRRSLGAERRGRASRWPISSLPLIFVIWLAFFRQEIPSFPPEGYSLKWFAAILDQRKFVDGFPLSLQVGVLATLIGLALGVPAALCVVRFQFALPRRRSPACC